MKLSDKIRILRKARGFSQEGLGFNLSRVNKDGISRQTVSDWENGKCEPKLENIRDLSQVLNVSFDALLDENIDLNDEEVLNRILKGITQEQREQVNSKFCYSIKQYSVSKKDYAMLIVTSVLLVIAIVFTIVYFAIPGWNISDTPWAFFIMCFLDAIALGLVYLPIPSLKTIIKHKSYVHTGELNNSHLIIYATGSADNVLYIPIEKVKSMKKVNPKAKRHGDIEVEVEGRVRKITLIDINNPDEVVDVFDRLGSYNENSDGIKVL